MFEVLFKLLVGPAAGTRGNDVAWESPKRCFEKMAGAASL